MKNLAKVSVLCCFFLLGCSTKDSTVVPKQDMFESFKPCPSSPNCVSSMSAKDASSYISPFMVNENVPFAKAQIKNIIAGIPNTKFIFERPHYFHATFKSSFFGFVDDVEFIFKPVNENQTVIEVKSASRLGFSDFGVNRKRVEKIRTILQEVTK